MNWKHVAIIGIGAGVALGSAFVPAAAIATALIALGSSLATGALGHAQGAKADAKKLGAK
jgi:hypothetical protein